MYDIAIIGGGPAGATLARFAGRSHRILLLEKRALDKRSRRGWQKCCGGLVAPDAQKMLASFGLGLPRSVILGPQIFAVRTIDRDNSIERYYQRHYINVDREEFDRWLESLIPPGVRIEYGTVYKGHEVLEDSVRVFFSKKGSPREERARLLVGADGASSLVRKIAFPLHPHPARYLAIQEWFAVPRNINYFGAVFDRAITDFYSWLIPKEEFLIVGSALSPNANAHGKFALLKSRLSEYGFDLKRSVRKSGSLLLRPTTPRQVVTGSGRVGLIGEAAGFISPTSAEGFSYAFRSALALSEALSRGIDSCLDAYCKNSSGLRVNLMLKRLKEPFMYNRVVRKMIMRSGIKSIDMQV
ncbi:MAG: FAD-binding protein [Spirochaetes bacterium]|nr:FAD-binding protein [Spirochaetota bacterium]